MASGDVSFTNRGRVRAQTVSSTAIIVGEEVGTDDGTGVVVSAPPPPPPPPPDKSTPTTIAMTATAMTTQTIRANLKSEVLSSLLLVNLILESFVVHFCIV